MIHLVILMVAMRFINFRFSGIGILFHSFTSILRGAGARWNIVYRIPDAISMIQIIHFMDNISTSIC